MYNDKFNKKVRVSYSPTCFMIIRKAVFEDIGMMDENYFVYWDDTDFVYRALKNGKTLWYIPNANIKHKESTSTGLKSDFSIYYLHRNMVYFTLKNRNFIYALYIILENLTIHLFKNIFLWKFSQWKLGLKAFFDGAILSFNSKHNN